ncbi:hypothetical protein IFR05_007968 [Cadophora sp. M221]|nr:hypothetical protein IFR05_007968 [Cadophora sp. M221]
MSANPEVDPKPGLLANPQWSTLEVVPTTLEPPPDPDTQLQDPHHHLDFEQVSPLSPVSDTEKEVTTEHEKELVVQDIGKQVTLIEGKEIPINEAPELIVHSNDESPAPKQPEWWKWRRLLIPIVLSIIAVITVGTVGGILGSRKKAPAGELKVEIVTWRRNVAAIPSFESEGGWLRVYYLDNQGEIVETVRSENGVSWKSKRLGFFAMNGSALAVTRSDMHFPAEIRIIFTNPLGILSDILWTPTPPNWTPGLLNTQKYLTSPNSGISTIYHQCYWSSCSNTALIAFQDMNNNIQIANQTTTGWTLTQLKTAYNISGSSLAMLGMPLCMPDSFCGDQEHSGEDQVMLFYQMGSGEVGGAIWAPEGGFTTYSDTKTPGWAPNTPFGFQPHAARHGTPIASSGWFPADTSVWLFWINTLSLSSTGNIVIDTLGIFSNSSTTRAIRSGFSPPVMAMAVEEGGKGEYISLAIVRTGFAVGVWRGEGEGERDLIRVWRAEEDGVTWSGNGTVDTAGFL